MKSVKLHGSSSDFFVINKCRHLLHVSLELASFSMSERSREAHQSWSSLDVAERDHWKRQAAEPNTCEPDELPASAKNPAVHASLRRLTAEVYFHK